MADNGPPKVKVLIIGASGVGKTCLLTRFCDEVTPSSTISTIGIDFKTKVVKVDGTAMRLLVYDTAGQEKYRTITSSFYRGSAGVVLVYDVTDEASFHSISELWMPRLEELSGKNVSKVLVGNKIDKEAARTVPTRLGEGLADEFGIPFFETSAMTGDGVENAFLHLAAAIKARVLDPVAEQRATADDPAVILTGIAGDSGRTLESVTMTLHYISLFVEYNVQTPFFRKALACWEDYRSRSFAAGLARREFVDEVVARLAAPVPMDKVVLTLVEQASSVQCALGLGEAGTMPNDPEKSAETLAKSLTSIALEGLLKASYEVPELHDNLLLFLKHPGITEGRLLSLLYMIRLFVATPTSNPLPTPTIMSLITTVKQFYLWPLPYASVAKTLLRELSRELRVPGSMWRDAYLRSNASLLEADARGAADEADAREGLAHVFLNISEPNLPHFSYLMHQFATERPTPTQIKYHFVVTTLNLLLDDGVDAEALGLSTCAASDIDALYTQLTALLAKAEALNDVAESKKLYTAGVTAIRDSITMLPPASTPGTQTAVASPSALRYNFLVLGDEYDDNVSASAVTVDDELHIPVTSGYGMLRDVLALYADAQAGVVDTVAPEDDDDPDGLDGDGDGESSGSRPQGKRIVKIGVGGSDYTLLNVVAGYVALLRTEPELVDKLQVQIYVLPFGTENALASFLGCFDGWYGRHMLDLSQMVARVMPHVGAPPAPVLDVFDAGGTLDVSMFEGGVRPDMAPNRLPVPQLSPGELLCHEIERYFTRGIHPLDVNIYLCEIWVASATRGGEPIHRTIPFVQRVEIGVNAAARSFRRKKGWSHLSLDDVVTHKSFKYTGPELTASFSEVSLSGLARPGPPIPTKQYWNVTVSNVPAPGQSGTPPRPSHSALELYCLDFDTGKRLQKGKSAVMDGERTYHASLIELQAKDTKKQFPIVIDGQLFEPVDKIRISPCFKGASNTQAALSVMTYFPLDL
ncbi:uncharacterized protein AMSG_11887 [Thecamonas trahens ATCC 50062]|uniref:Uncharacterized protein n=1 Tax=Thecamonas trahens ATCC 50062 TaxID=461836 RepID=A0A0L0DBA2_THETB|nr:hypothetical protein AMSG_11887 [Thecamonas trahens ATCC 50062]KNC49530.1 hypothetical protein AMSG_11887 [Thecamonas trahens ATCC 50062]|eukprot:XP_013757761.1 hypothetical protein AMSG_11887 [Thecamonas trahens ATCC 50062]